MKNCNCHSYNADKGETPEVLLKMLVSIDAAGTRTYRDVAIDACIAPVIKHLWDNDIATIGSCCGHNRMQPSIVLAEGVDHYSYVRKLIRDIDPRLFELSQWHRVLV